MSDINDRANTFFTEELTMWAFGAPVDGAPIICRTRDEAIERAQAQSKRMVQPTSYSDGRVRLTPPPSATVLVYSVTLKPVGKAICERAPEPQWSQNDD